MVTDAEVRYVLVGASGGGPGGGGASSAISSWVKAHGTAVSSSGVTSGTLYRVSA